MLENFSVTLLSGITVSLIFEILKGIFISIHNRICEKSLPFTVSGYWGTYHSSNDYSAFEFVVIKHQGVGLRVRLYQKQMMVDSISIVEQVISAVIKFLWLIRKQIRVNPILREHLTYLLVMHQSIV